MDTLTIISIIALVGGGLALAAYFYFGFRTRDRRSCMYCSGELLRHSHGWKCPACNVLYEDPRDDPMNIS